MRDVSTLLRAAADKCDEFNLLIPATFEVPYVVLVDKVRNAKSSPELEAVFKVLVKMVGASTAKQPG